jgi:hypothetical protein
MERAMKWHTIRCGIDITTLGAIGGRRQGRCTKAR